MIQNPDGSYDNAFSTTNVYGRALSLLKKRVPKNSNTEGPFIHLDIGCGYGNVAEHITTELGLTYVGIDANPNGLASLSSRGFENHSFLLSSEEDTTAFLYSIIGERQLSSISLLDTLEHLPEGDAVLRAIRTVAARYNVIVILSVPNMSHRDIGFKLALGSWNYTDAGLLDHTHVRLFDSSTFSKVLRQAGLHIVDRNDVRQNHSDQYFPTEHPVLATSTTLRFFLKRLRSQVDDNDDVNQMVVACLPGPAINEKPFVIKRKQERPFLSVITRTQGTRIHCLTEHLVCLAGQSSRDFEVLIIGHRLNVDQQIAVEKEIDDCPEWLRVKIRLILCDRGGRAQPLNMGFEEARGKYIAILDDDDIAMGHWVESFIKLSVKNDGCILRLVSVKQNVATVSLLGRTAIRAEGTLEKCYPSEFVFIDHLEENYSPNNTLAFPRGPFHDLNIRFDDNLTTAEDWDYILRVGGIVGVASSSEITGIYRWWVSDQSSRTDHDVKVWQRNHALINAKIDQEALLLPPGSSIRIRELLRQTSHYAEGWAFSGDSASAGRESKLLCIQSLLESNSWLITAPIRFLGRLIKGGRTPKASDHWHLTEDELDVVISQILHSRSWRLTAPLRKLKER